MPIQLRDFAQESSEPNIVGLDSEAVSQPFWDCLYCKFDDDSVIQIAARFVSDLFHENLRANVECLWFSSAQCRFDDKLSRKHSEDEMKENYCERRLQD